MKARRTIRLAWHAALALLVVLAGCDINPVPEPPSIQSVEGPQVDHVVLAPDPMMASDDLDVLGGPGAAEAGDQIWVVNLDNTQAPSVVTVQADGSFTLKLHGLSGDELRLQARRGGLRSAPMDVVVPASAGPAQFAVRPLADCLLLDPPLELSLPAPDGATPPSASIAVENRCGTDVVIESVGLRAPTSSFVVEPLSPTIPDQGVAQIMAHAYGSPGDEAVLLLRILSPQAERRPVTLFSRGGPSGVQPACELVGGTCMSDPADVGFPADCEALGQQTMQASCVAFNHACCIAVP